MRDEILASSSIGAGERHAECTSLVSARIHLVTNCVPRTAVAVIARIAVLRNEIGHNTMESSAAIIAGARQVHEVPHSDRRISAKQLENNVSMTRLDRCTLCLTTKRRNHVC